MIQKVSNCFLMGLSENKKMYRDFEMECFKLRFEDVRESIRNCEGKHMQQVAYSSYHDAVTQICFGCRKIKTSMKGV